MTKQSISVSVTVDVWLIHVQISTMASKDLSAKAASIYKSYKPLAPRPGPSHSNFEFGNFEQEAEGSGISYPMTLEARAGGRGADFDADETLNFSETDFSYDEPSGILTASINVNFTSFQRHRYTYICVILCPFL